MVENTTKSQFEVLHALSRFLTVSEIAKYRKTSRTAVYKHIDRLIQKGLIRKIGKIYELTDEGNVTLHNATTFKGAYRLHNFGIRAKILKTTRNWEQKKNQAVLLKSFTKQWELKSGTNELYSIVNIKIKTTPKSIIFYMPTTYGKTPDEALRQTMELFFKNIPKVENLFKVTLIKDRKLSIDIISQHYAKLNDSLARLYRKEGNKLHITGDDGKVWLIADYSFKTDELEFIHTEKAYDDVNTIVPFLNDVRKHPEIKVSELKEMIFGVTKNQIMFAENMKSHVKAIQELGAGVKALTKAVKKTKEPPRKSEGQSTLDKFK